MHLRWSDQDGIAKALSETYPDMDRLGLSMDSLCQLITILPGFDDTPEPPRKAYLEKILWTWMRLADHDGLGAREAG